jgi:hypothetical protein
VAVLFSLTMVTPVMKIIFLYSPLHRYEYS